MLFAKLFGILAIICAIAWVILYAVMISVPVIGIILSIPIMLFGWGFGISVILAIVFYVLKK